MSLGVFYQKGMKNSSKNSIDSIKTVQSFNLNGYLVKIRLFKQIGLLLLCSHCFQSNIKKKRGQQHEYSKIGTKNGVIRFVVGRFLPKGDEKFVKKRRDPKMGTVNEVSNTRATQ